MGWAILIPMWFAALSGLFNVELDSSTTLIVGGLMLTFGTWGAYRLIKETKQAEIKPEVKEVII